MDRRPQQVLVETTILVASLDDNNQFGIDFEMLGGVDFTATNGVVGSVPAGAVALSSTTSSGSTAFSSNVSSGGLSIGVVKNNIGVFIRALESITDVVSLGNPKVLTLNRQFAKVIVGNEDGYITTEVSQTSTTQTVEFLETGTQLEFRPFVMSDGYIRMELKPEDSDGGVSLQGGFLVPSKTTAEVSTNVLVRDGHTIVIGGLFRDRTELIRSQVPLVGNVPILGNLFRSTLDNNTREEVIFLVTPHIVDEPLDYAAADEVLDASNRRMYAMREGMQWHARNRLAEAHYDSAVRHYEAGNMGLARWDAGLAGHVNAGFLDAVDLRNQLEGKDTRWGETGSMRLFMRRLIEQDGLVQGVIEPAAQVDVPEPETSVSAEQVDEPIAVKDAESKEAQESAEAVDEDAEITAMVIEATSSQ
jgi:type II secretory pathway component GspD/PulD (secretin)